MTRIAIAIAIAIAIVTGATSGFGVRVTSIEPGLAESEFTLLRIGGDKAWGALQVHRGG